MRSREQRVESEAQQLKHFGAFDRSRTASKTIPVVSHPGGLALGNGEVVAAFGKYNAKLFSSRANPETAPPAVLGELPAVPQEVKTLINEPISVEEVN